MSDQFTCELCKGTFDKEWTDEEALTEAEEFFGPLAGVACATVCDDCWRRVMAPMS